MCGAPVVLLHEGRHVQGQQLAIPHHHLPIDDRQVHLRKMESAVWH